MESTGAPTQRHRVGVVGGGFGGLQAAKHLATAPVDLTLVADGPVLFNGAVVRELLVDLDDEARPLVWSVVDGPYPHHNGSAQVFDDGENRTPVWIADPLPNRTRDPQRPTHGTGDKRHQGDTGVDDRGQEGGSSRLGAQPTARPLLLTRVDELCCAWLR